MIYLDSSVAFAHLLAEDRFPPDALWEEQPVSSRLLECEVWNRITAGRGSSIKTEGELDFASGAKVHRQSRKFDSGWRSAAGEDGWCHGFFLRGHPPSLRIARGAYTESECHVARTGA
jgi:hypothetical protein